MITSFLVANLSQSEAEFRTDLFLCWAGLIVIAAIVVAAFALHSWKIAAVAVLFVLLYSILLKPWRFLVPLGTDASGDPWSVNLQRLGVGWVIVAVIALASLALGVAFRSPKYDKGDIANDTNNTRSQCKSPPAGADRGRLVN